MAEPRDIVVNGNGTATNQYSLPGAVFQYVEAIYVTVDNTGGGNPVRPTLTVENGSGVVIAAKRQGDSIPAADTGSATWALRLTDEGGGKATGPTKSGFYTLGPTVVASGNTVPLDFAVDFGDPLLDLTVPNTPQIIAAGTYLLRATVLRSVVAAFTGKVEMVRIAMNANYGAAETVAGSAAPMDTFGTTPQMSPVMPWVAAAGTFLQVGADHNAGVNRTYQGAFNIVQLG